PGRIDGARKDRAPESPMNCRLPIADCRFSSAHPMWRAQREERGAYGGGLPIAWPEAKNRKSKIVNRKSLRAFTMIEIAISLAVIGFALAAIVGVLPLGMKVQKQNR